MSSSGQRTEILSDVPGSELERIVASYRAEGASVTWQGQGDGLFEITAIFPAPSGAVAPSPPPAAPAPPPIGPAPAPEVASGGTPWDRLIRRYRDFPGVSAALKVATLAQWILESGRGDSALARDHLNFAGLKYRARMAAHAQPVDYTGSDGEATTYCKFQSVDAFIAGYWHFIDSGPYDGWRDHGHDGAAYIRHIAARGYAPGAHYPAKVMALFEEASGLLRLGPPAPHDPTVADPNSLLRLGIVVGHNRVSKGAPAKLPIGRAEFDFNSVVADAMKSAAVHYNITPRVFLREPGPNEIPKAYAAVAAWGADCAVELHFNGANPCGDGTEVLCNPDSRPATELAAAIASEIQATLGFRLRHPRGVKPIRAGERGWGSVSALPQVPSVLVEPFFGCNETECRAVAALGEAGLARLYLRGARSWAMARLG